jgi:hypothetical protein
MPPDPEDLNRQLEALQRYVDRRLADQRERGEAAAARPAPEARRPPGRWLLVTGLLVVVALVGGLFVGAVAWSDDRPGGAGTGAGGAGTSPATSAPGATGAAAPVASPACKTAVDRANTMLATAVELRRTLAEYDRILHDPANRRLSTPALRRKLDPVLRAGDGESARLDQALAAYRQGVDQCRLHTP